MVAKKYPDKSNRDKTNIAMTSRASEMSIEMRMHSQKNEKPPTVFKKCASWIVHAKEDVETVENDFKT